MGISAFWQLYDNIIPLILKNSFALGETVTGVIMATDNILAVMLLPVLGSCSDRVDTRLGKRIPFIIVGTVLSAFFMMWIPIADTTQNLQLFILGLGALLISMGLYRSPAVALMPDLTPPELRSQGNAVINVMGAVGAMFSLAMIQILVEHTPRPDYTLLFISIAFVMVAGMLILVSTIKEKKLAEKIRKEYPDFEVEKTEEANGKHSPEVVRSMIYALMTVFFYYMSYNGVTTAFSRYAQEVWGLTGGSFAVSLMIVAVTAFISYIPLGALTGKYGRKRIIGIGFFMMITSFVALSFVDEFHLHTNFWFVFVGIGGSAVGVNIFPVIVDMCYNKEVGKYTGLYYTFSMLAQIITPIASGFLLEHVSYRILFPYAALFSTLGIATLANVHHGDTKPEKNIMEYLDN